MDNIVDMLYNKDEYEKLFDGEMYVTIDNVDGVVVKRVIRNTGELLIGVDLLNVVPLIDTEIFGYLLIDEELNNKMYNSFFRITGMSDKIEYDTISLVPIYLNVPILTRECSVLPARALISPCKTLFPSMQLTFKKANYIGKFSIKNGEMTELRRVGNI